MKWMLLGVFGILLAWSLWAWSMVPDPATGRVTEITLVSDDTPARQATVQLFNKLNPDIKLVLDPNNIGLGKVIVQCKGGVGPDVFNVYGRWHLIDYVRTGVLLPLNDYAEQWGIGMDKTWPEVVDDLSELQFNPETGKHERIQYTVPGNVNANVIIYNKRIFDEAGVPYPKGEWTWDQCLDVAKRVTRRDEDGKTLIYGLSTFEFLETSELLWQFGADFFDETCTYCTMDTPEAIEAMTFLYRMMAKERVMPTIDQTLAMAGQSGSGGMHMNLFAQQRIAMIRTGRWAMVTFRLYPALKGRIGAVQLPYQRYKVGLVKALSVGINRQSPNREAALRYLQFLASDEFSRLVLETGDALPPSEKIARSEAFLHDPDHPEEDFNAEFIEAMRRGRTHRMSPFVEIFRMERTMNRDIAMLGQDRISPEKMCRTFTDEINGHIQTNLTRYASMREEYKRRTGRDFDPDHFPPKD